MKLIYTLLFCLFTYPTISQTYFGTARNTCPGYRNSSTVMAHVKNLGGNRRKAYVVETSNKFTTKFEFEFFLNNGSALILRSNLKNIAVSQSKFVQYQNSACICEDNFDLITGQDGAISYLQTECTAHCVYWSLESIIELPRLPNKPIKKVRSIKKA